MQPLWRPLVYGVVLAAVWTGLAWAYRATFHLAPLLVGAIVPIGVALAPSVPAMPLRLAGAVAGATVALAATLALALGGRLQGSSLLPSGGAAAEAVAFSLAGAAMGLALGMARRR
jgi:hypothetical protein